MLPCRLPAVGSYSRCASRRDSMTGVATADSGPGSGRQQDAVENSKIAAAQLDRGGGPARPAWLTMDENDQPLRSRPQPSVPRTA